jgi:hypothetical protein
MSVKLFPARYNGICRCCDEPIEVGDWVGYLDDEVCCEDCIDAAGEETYT